MQRTKIEYLTHTWNPLAMRCSWVSTGCDNCWHRSRANMLSGNPIISQERRDAYAGKGAPVLIEKELYAPGKLRKPAIIGVQFMGDLYHEEISDEALLRAFREMGRLGRHQFIVLTKRPKRIQKFWDSIGQTVIPDNIWFGVSVSTNDDLWMIDELLRASAKHRIVSYEPALGAVDFKRWLPSSVSSMKYNKLDWVIAGGETGNGARHCDPEWIRSVWKQCKDADVPFFFKQWGRYNNTIKGILSQNLSGILDKQEIENTRQYPEGVTNES